MSESSEISFIEELIDELHDIRDRIENDTNKSRAKSIAITKIQEAEMWLNEDIDS